MIHQDQSVSIDENQSVYDSGIQKQPLISLIHVPRLFVIYMIYLISCTLIGSGVWFYWFHHNENGANGSLDLIETQIVNANHRSLTSLNTTINPCTIDTKCGAGRCIDSVCQCNPGYLSLGAKVCDYHQLSGGTALALSIILGIGGVDRIYLSRGNIVYLVLGILKGFSVGGLGVFWIVDIILISAGLMLDGNGHPLAPI